MESQEEKYRQLLQEARSREEKFRKALRGVLKALACDSGDFKIRTIISEALQEDKGDDFQ